jgi:hypothetical protein
MADADADVSETMKIFPKTYRYLEVCPVILEWPGNQSPYLAMLLKVHLPLESHMANHPCERKVIINPCAQGPKQRYILGSRWHPVVRYSERGGGERQQLVHLAWPDTSSNSN